MFRTRWLLPVQLRDQSAAGRTAIAGHAQPASIGRRQWTDVAERSGESWGLGVTCDRGLYPEYGSGQ